MLSALTSRYAEPVDYAELAVAVPALSPFLRPGRDKRATIDFRDDAAVRALNQALLLRDFNIKLELPADRLCPTVPSRHEYALFVLRLALMTSPDAVTPTTLPPLVGVDVGTGASAIYPMLASRTLSRLSPVPSSRLRMFATDIDSHSLDWARQNVFSNGLAETISVMQVDARGAIFPPEVVNTVNIIDFTMCNPPFYASQDEIDASLAAKQLEPFAVCTGADNEMVTDGGEVVFVSQMVKDSVALGKTKIRWFTTLLGKYSSIAPLVDLLKSHQIHNYHVIALPQHGHTVRWILSWSLQDRRFPPDLLYLSPTLDSKADSTTSSPLSSSASSRFPLARFYSPAVTPSTYRTPLSLDISSAPIVRDALDEVLRELVGSGGTSGAAGSGADGEERAVKRPRMSRDESGQANEAASERGALEWRWDGRDAATSGEEGGESGDEVWIRAWRNVWSRKARRAGVSTSSQPGKAADPPVAGAPAAPASDLNVAKQLRDPAAPLLELRIRLVQPAPASPPTAQSSSASPTATSVAPAQVKLTAHWVRGLDADRAAFTGLWSFLSRKVGDKLKARAGGAQVGRRSGM
ncbi:uncharacterized protein JCM10292_005001 [Rhodotorula paludigena]|uniref:uncharacterized protein n=1 Tax=Rhodotorula paludigena TaxID=86838 RepID=UPI00316E584F